MTDAHTPAAPTPSEAALHELLAQIERRLPALGETERRNLQWLLAMVERRSRPRRAVMKWSRDPTGGDRERWPAAWVVLLPQWIARAAAVQVAHLEVWDGDEFRGPRASLVSLGLLSDGDFPGDAGRGRSMVTFAPDGYPKQQGKNLRESAVSVRRSGARFIVKVYAPRDELTRRRAQCPDEVAAIEAAAAILYARRR